MTAALQGPGDSVTDHVCAVLHAQLSSIQETYRRSVRLTPVAPQSVMIGPLRAVRLADFLEDFELALARLDGALAVRRPDSQRVRGGPGRPQ